MRNIISGIIGVLLGGVMLLTCLKMFMIQGRAAYHSGNIGGAIIGALFFIIGLYYLIKGGKKKQS